jgi:capsular exopolysaccharide synthesis family protein
MAEARPNDIIDLRAIFRKLLAHWWWFLITCILSGALGVAYLKTTPKTFLVHAKMFMGEGSKQGLGQKEDFLKGMSLVRGNSQIEDDIALLTSRTNVRKTLNRMDLAVSCYETHNFLTQERYDYPPFIIKLDSLSLQVTGIPVYVAVDKAAGTYHVKAEGKNVMLYNVQKQEIMNEFMPKYKVEQTVPIGKPFIAEHLSFSIDFPEDRKYRDGSKYFFKINSMEGLLQNYRSRLTVSPPEKDGHIVDLAIVGQVPSKEIAFLSKLMETYRESELYKQQQKGYKTISFIDDQIGNVSDSLRRVESSMESFRGQSSGLVDVGRTSDALFQERSRLEDERSTIIRRRNYCASVLDKIRTSSDLRNVPAPSSSGIDDPVLNNLVIEITRLYADLAAQNLSTGARSNPTVIAMERRIKNLTSSLAQTAESLVEQADMSLAEVNRRLGGINYQFNQLPENERRLVNIERKFKLSDNLYNYLMEKRAEAGIAIASDQVDKFVVDEPLSDSRSPISPDKKMVLGGALLFGLLLPLVVILLRDFFNDKIADVDELKRLSPIQVLALIPTSKRKRVTPDEPKSMLAESFRTARINLQYLNVGTQRQVIGFTSSTSGEGKSFCALNMASVMAISGKRTLLIDADMRRPRVAEMLGLPDGQGLSSYLIGEASLDNIIRHTDVAGLDVITAGPVPPNPLELVETPRFAELFQTLRGRYDHIIVDASPMGLVSEFVILTRYIDVTMYIVRRGYTRRGALRTVNEIVQQGKLTNVDLLFNDVKPGDGYGDGYGYYTK